MATVRVTYYGMDGEGKNVTEAKRHAGAKIEKALSGSYTPELLTHRGYTILVYREPSGWHTSIIAEPDGIRPRICGYSSPDSDRAEAIRAAYCQLAQLGWQHTDGETAPDFLTERSDIAHFAYWARFQLRFRAAREAGFCSNDCHDYAGRNPAKADLIARVEAKLAEGTATTGAA